MSLSDVSSMSTRYDVSRLCDSHAEAILALYRTNPQYFLHCEAEATREQVMRDLHEAPPGVEARRKHFLGFFDHDVLVAIIDLVEDYPEPGTIYIGLFMVGTDHQGCGVGRHIMDEVSDRLRKVGFSTLRLAIARDNPQANGFWESCGFVTIKEVRRNGWPILVAERRL